MARRKSRTKKRKAKRHPVKRSRGGAATSGAARLYESLRDGFERMGCDTSTPGFYHSQGFLEAEQQDPTILERYADFVLARPQDEQELKTSVEKIRAAADFLHQRVAESGRLGACIDASLVLSEFLNQLGVWNYVVKGAASVFFPRRAGIEPMKMQPIMVSGNPASTGHAWVVAPPFVVVDLTISLQPYPEGAKSFLPAGYVAEQRAKTARPNASDLVEAVDLLSARLGRAATLRDVFKLDPGLEARITKYGCREASAGRVLVRYTACGIGASDTPLEAMMTTLGGLRAPELYAEFQPVRSLLSDT